MRSRGVTRLVTAMVSTVVPLVAALSAGSLASAAATDPAPGERPGSLAEESAAIRGIPADPWTPDLSGARGDGERPTVQAALDRVVADGALGVVARVDTPGRSRAWAAGDRRVYDDAPARPGAAFRVASNTKTMVATAVMREIERGTWRLGTTVDEIAPGLLGEHGSVTVRQLLAHRSGMPDGVMAAVLAKVEGPLTWRSMIAALGEEYSDREIIDAALGQDWLFPPGERFAYSNAGYVTLGQLLERENRRPLAAVLRERVFVPAGMRDAVLATDPPPAGGSLVDAMRVPRRWFGLGEFDPDVFSGAGAVSATTRDLDAFNKALLTGRLLRPSTVATMTGLTSANGYGLGIYRLPDPCTPPEQPMRYLYGHDGASFGTFSLSLGSSDGTRQVSFGVTGRYYTDEQGGQPYDLNALAARLLAETC